LWLPQRRLPQLAAGTEARSKPVAPPPDPPPFLPGGGFLFIS
jgi:hypothetical protein